MKRYRPTHLLSSIPLIFLCFLTIDVLAEESIPTRTQPPTEIHILLDVSASMEDSVWFSQKLAHVTEGIEALLEGISEEDAIGLRIFGQTTEECPEPELLVPIATGTRPQIMANIKSLQPGGGTPLGRALELAIDDFSDDNRPKRLILLSDGLPTCEPLDVCSLVRSKVVERGIEVRLDLVGVVLDPGAKEGLECLLMGGGTFIEIGAADIASERAWRSVGELASGAARPAGEVFLRLIASLLVSAMNLLFVYFIAEILYRKDVRQLRAGLLSTLAFILLEAVMLTTIWVPLVGGGRLSVFPLLGVGFVALALLMVFRLNQRSTGLPTSRR